MAQALAVWNDVIALAPELTLVPAGMQPIYLRVAGYFVPLTAFGLSASDAHAALTAHLLTVSPSGTALGLLPTLTSEADGPSSRSFATAAMSDELLSSTSYGQIYMALRKLARVGRGLVANGETFT